MVRPKSCNKLGLKKGPWTPEEDQKLLAYIQEHGHGSWRSLPSKAGLQRCGKSCRLRWSNYLRPDIKRGKFNLQEEQSIIQLHALLGNRWSAIATHLPRRTDNEIKNYWNTYLKKKLDKMGIDPVTHKPKTNSLSSSKSTARLSHMAQWESARLQAEARLVRESKLLNQIQAQAQAQAQAQTKTQTWAGAGAQNRSSPTNRPTQPTQPTMSTTSRPQCLDVLKAWQGVVFGMFSAGAGGGAASLESPTSTLKFPSSHALPPTVNPPTDPVECNSNKLRKEHCWDPLMHETMAYSINNGCWFAEPVKAGDDVDGGISDILLGQNSEYSSSDKKNVNCYWSSLLNLVDTPASDQNPGVF